MLDFVLSAIIIATLASWIVLFITKIGLREYVQIHGSKIVAELFSCDFCLSWWVCLMLSVICSIITGDLTMVLCAFCATPISRYLI